MCDGHTTEEQLHKDAGTGFPFGDPEFIATEADKAGFFEPYNDDGSGPVVFAGLKDGYASASDLRIFAQEMDNRNGISVQSETDGADSYSIRGLSRRQLLAITQLVGRAQGESSDTLTACIDALGYDDSLEGLLGAQRECDNAFPDFAVAASF